MRWGATSLPLVRTPFRSPERKRLQVIGCAMPRRRPSGPAHPPRESGHRSQQEGRAGNVGARVFGSPGHQPLSVTLDPSFERLQIHTESLEIDDGDLSDSRGRCSPVGVQRKQPDGCGGDQEGEQAYQQAGRCSGSKAWIRLLTQQGGSPGRRRRPRGGQTGQPLSRSLRGALGRRGRRPRPGSTVREQDGLRGERTCQPEPLRY